jgi:hypothetical protein
LGEVVLVFSTTGKGAQANTAMSSNPQQSVTSVVELIAKAAALVVISCYVIGYLLVAINDSNHGFLEAGLVKPRAIAAGAIFIFVTVLPSLLTQRAFPAAIRGEPESKRQVTARWLLGLTDYVGGSAVAALVMSSFFVSGGPTQPQSTSIAPQMVLVCVALANAFIRFGAVALYKERPVVWALFCLAGVTAISVALYRLRGSAMPGCFGWSFGVSAVMNSFLSDIKRGIRPLPMVGIASLLLALSAIPLYALFFFPFMKPSWGGGAPIPIVVYLSKDYPIRPSEKLKANLLETSDSGFYLTFGDDEKVTYVPRASVAAMEFTNH